MTKINYRGNARDLLDELEDIDDRGGKRKINKFQERRHKDKYSDRKERYDEERYDKKK